MRHFHQLLLCTIIWIIESYYMLHKYEHVVCTSKLDYEFTDSMEFGN